VTTEPDRIDGTRRLSSTYGFTNRAEVDGRVPSPNRLKLNPERIPEVPSPFMPRPPIRRIRPQDIGVDRFGTAALRTQQTNEGFQKAGK